jgi:2-polyprenyl-3-methyl-5-hydroxy-6-metoxy-1,4-benzoquinol methylase
MLSGSLWPMKYSLANILAYGTSKYFKWLSLSNRVDFLMQVIHLVIKKETPENTLKFLFEIENRLYSLEGRASIEYDNGIHTKHRLINYHHFFINNINSGEKVLDIGCGNGAMDYDIVTHIQNVKVLGIDLNKENIHFARSHHKHANLNFIHGDVLNTLPDEKFDVVLLSNVLEHIEKRVGFLKRIIKQLQPKRFIIRVPLFERDWRVPLKKELGIDYRLDPTHYIEYTKEEYYKELDQVGLTATHTEYRWVEIWSVVESLKK